ncbi:MAG: tyrosine-type recombinase/integrase [Nitrososphaera sp.]
MQPPITVTPYDRTAFMTFLQTVKEQEFRTARDNATFVATFIKSGKTPEDFIRSYEKPNSYNNALKAVNHYCDFLGVPRPNLKPKPRAVANLIIAPKPDEVKDLLRKLQSQDVKAYIALCATVGLRPQRLLRAKWSEIDFENNIVNINERHGKKVYRPNYLHKDAAALLQELKKTSTSERVFTFGYKKVAQELKAIGTKWRPNNMRDHFYNEARRHCDHDQIEWCMGHSLPGVRAHYLADELKQEYAKFEEKFRLEIA